MDYSNLKPDYQRIAFALRIDSNPKTISIPSPISTSLNKNIIFKRHTTFINSIWEILTNNEIPYDGENKKELEFILSEFNLTIHLNDLLFLLSYFKYCKHRNDSINENEHLRLATRSELLATLKYLYDNTPRKLKIEILNKTEKSGTTLLNPLFIDVIKKSLLDFLIQNVPSVKQDIVDIENFDQWPEYIDFMIIQENPVIKKGRKPKHTYTVKIIDALQIYLQEYTVIKAEMNTPISNRQSSFIYRFLTDFNLIQDSVTYEEDNVRLNLKKYRKMNNF